jgi:3-oxoacyl-[acyl-carrier protein] reductase
VASQVRQLGRTGIAQACDVADRDAVETAVAYAAETLGRIDILVNNAGGGFERTQVASDDPDNWVLTVQVNLLGTYFCSRAVLPIMKKSGGGQIINVGSGMGHQPRAGNSSYNVSKAGVWMFTRCLAMEVWQDNIRVNELIPGPVATGLTADIFNPGQHPSMSSEWVKLPKEVAPLALFLATQNEHGPTGQSFSLARRPI